MRTFLNDLTKGIQVLVGEAIDVFPNIRWQFTCRDVQVVFVPVGRESDQVSAKERFHALMAHTPKQDGEPYVFHRADAYEEEMA